MRKTNFIFLFVLAVSFFLLPSSLLAENITQKTTNNKFSVTMTPPEDGLSVGKNKISLKIYDADDYEVVGATVNVKPWMPGMGHGVFLEPTVQEKNNGVYEIENVGFSMPGHWQLIVSVKTDSAADQATFEFENIPGEMGAGCSCGPDCQCEHCRTGKGPCACKVGAKGEEGCTCGPDCKCEHCTTGKGPCACKLGAQGKAGCSCGPDCQCEHCRTGKGPCACKVGAKGEEGCTCGPDCKCEHCTTGKGPCLCKVNIKK